MLISAISKVNLREILGKYQGRSIQISDIYKAYLRCIPGIFQSYHRHISGYIIFHTLMRSSQLMQVPACYFHRCIFCFCFLLLFQTLIFSYVLFCFSFCIWFSFSCSYSVYWYCFTSSILLFLFLFYCLLLFPVSISLFCSLFWVCLILIHIFAFLFFYFSFISDFTPLILVTIRLVRHMKQENIISLN